jgi:hypothetical protein
MKPTRMLSYSILFLVLMPMALGLGIVPAEREVVFASGQPIDVTMKIVNNDGFAYDVFLHAEGELEPYVQFENPLLSFADGEKEKTITYRVNLPANFEKQGDIGSKITVRQLPKKDAQGKTFSASVAVSQHLVVKVPYSGKYAEARIATGKLEKGKEGFFNVEVHNLGDEDLLSLKPVITIIGPLNNKVAVITGDELVLRSKEKKKFPMKWTPTIGGGNYIARLSVSDGEFSLSEELAFTIGEPTLSVDSINVDNFKLGGVAKFALAVSSNWNLPIEDAYAKIKVEDTEGKLYAEYKTANTDFEPFAMQVIDAFWDTSQVLAGSYKLLVDLHYLEKTSHEEFDIQVDSDEITTQQTVGNVIAEEGDDNNLLRIVLLFLGVQTIFLVGFIIYRTKKRKNES